MTEEQRHSVWDCRWEFDCKVTNMSRNEKLNTEGHCLIARLKEGLEIIGKTENKDISEKEAEAICLQLQQIKAEAVKYDIEGRRLVLLEELPQKLTEAGLASIYAQYNDELLKNGFVMDSVIEEDLVQSRRMFYHYHGDFSTWAEDGDLLVFLLCAELNENGLDIHRTNGQLVVNYLGYVDDETPLRNPEGIPKVYSFLDKHRGYLCDFSEKRIKIDSMGCFCVHLEDPGCIARYKEALIKLEVLLEKELQRAYPFESIRGYELHSQSILEKTIKYIETFQAPDKTPPMMWRYDSGERLCLNHDSLLDCVVRCSYHITKDEAIEKFSKAASNLLKYHELTRDIGGSPGCCRARGKEGYTEEEYVAKLVSEIQEMSNEEFETYKDRLFDI